MPQIGKREWLALAIGVVLVLALGIVGWNRPAESEFHGKDNSNIKPVTGIEVREPIPIARKPVVQTAATVPNPEETHRDILPPPAPLPASERTADQDFSPTGRLSILLLDALGRPAAGTGELMLRRVAFEAKDGEGSQAFEARAQYQHGRAEFATTPLNSVFEVSFQAVAMALTKNFGTSRTRVTKEIIGPTDRKPNAVRTMTIDGDFPLLRGRALDTEGEPHEKMHLYMNLTVDGSHTFSSGQTGEDGSFLLALHSHLEGKSIDVALISGQADLQPVDIAHLAPFRRGILELGDIVFEERVSLVAGKVISGGGSKNKGYGLSVQHRPNLGSEWRHLQTNADIEQSSFRVSGVLLPGQYRLQVTPTPGSFMSPEPIEFVPGQEDLEVRLERGRALAVTVHVPGDPQHLYPLRQPYEFLLRSVRIPAKSLPRWGGVRERGSGAVMQWQGLAEGTYQLELWIGPAPEPFRIFPGIHVPGPVGPSAKAEVDLTRDFREITLHLRSAAALPPKTRVSAYLLHRDHIVSTFNWSERTVSLLVLPGNMDLIVTAPGYLPVFLHGLSSDLDVVLEAFNTSLEARLTNSLALPQGTALRARLQATTGLPPGWHGSEIEELQRSAWNEVCSNTNYAELLRSSGTFDPSGQARFEIQRPGSQKITLELIPKTAALRIRWNTPAIEIDDFSPKTIDLQPSTETQTFELQVSQAAIDTALRTATSK